MKNKDFIIILLFISSMSIPVWSNTGGESYLPAWDIYINSWEQKKDVLLVETVEGLLTLHPYQFGSLHYQLVPLRQKENKSSYAVIKDFPSADFKVEESVSDLTLITDNYKFVLNKFTGNFSFYNTDGTLLLQETGNKHKPIKEDSILPRSLFKITQNEALYGLGQFRDNALNLRGIKRELVQFNTQSTVPVIYSTAGWGMFWDNPSRTVFEDTPEGMIFTSDYENMHTVPVKKVITYKGKRQTVKL